MFPLSQKYFKILANTRKVAAWKSKKLSNESIKPPSTNDSSLNPGVNYFVNTKMEIEFYGSCLKQDEITFTHEQVVNIYIFLEINLWNYVCSDDPMPGNALFGAVKLVKK